MQYLTHISGPQKRGALTGGLGWQCRFGSKADIAVRLHNVRFTPESGHSTQPGNHWSAKRRRRTDVGKDTRCDAHAKFELL
jgi:hypothetical protein